MQQRRTPPRLLRGAVVLTLALVATLFGPARAATAAVAVPGDDGSVFGIAVYDRQAGWVTTQNSSLQFRSASVVKIMIAVDFLERNPTFSGSQESALQRMLRGSDDDDATYFWNLGGRNSIITRMVSKMGLQNTTPPSDPGLWGFTNISAADVVRMYLYLLNTNPGIGSQVMGELRQSHPCADDGFDQSFGIPSAFRSPVAVKQGWSGFGGSFRGCPAPMADVPSSSTTSLPVAMHTTGTVGSGDRAIVAVLSLQPHGTAAEEASERVTRVTQALNVPGATYAPPPAATPGTWFPTWSSFVNVRPTASTSGSPVDILPAGQEVYISCQQAGSTVTAEGVTNRWWAFLPSWGGFISNIYVDSPADTEPGVPICGSGGYPFKTWGTNVNVRVDAHVSSTRTTVLAGPTEVIVDCQKQGDTVTAEGVTNSWWSKLRGLGYVTNIYLDYQFNKLPTVPLC